MALSEKTCTPCQGGIDPMSESEAKGMLEKVPGWQLKESGKMLFRRFSFDDFKSALAFVNKAGELAEQEQHHPDITFGWGYAEVTIYTHKIGGLHENDFILAAKIGEVG